MAKEKTFNLDLAFLRNEQGISQRELATRMGITQPSIKQIEDNFNDIKISSLKKYINALGMTLTVKASSVHGKSSTYLLKDVSVMDNSNSFFDKIVEDKKRRESEIENIIEEENKKRERDKFDLELFQDETKKLSQFIQESLSEHLIVKQYEECIVGDYYKINVLATEITYNDINIYLQPTGPRFGTVLGRGVIEIRSNSKFFNLNPYVTLSLILQVKKGETYWVIHRRDGISHEWKQERLNKDSLYTMLETLIF